MANLLTSGKTEQSCRETAGLGSLSAEDISEFQALLERECGVRLDASEAWRRATQLIDLTRMLLGPIPEDPGKKPPLS